MRVDLFDFDLPEALIALRPARPRDSARLLHVPADGAFEDRIVSDAPSLFRPGDLLVFNDTRVIPARLSGVRARAESSVAVEATLIERVSPSRWVALAKPGKRLREGDRIRFGTLDDRACLLGALDAVVAAKGEDGAVTLAFDLAGADLDAAIAGAGAMPLPPYIAAKRAPDDDDVSDYQTFYAREDGAVAAPTAGLHFTHELFERLIERGLRCMRLTLHVGAGTFLPVKAADTSQHLMHSEWRAIPEGVAFEINRAKSEGRRVIAVGTSSLRALESAADESGRVRAEAGQTDIFITPGYRFRVVDGLWTNFHLPRSTLFMLVCAFAGLERMRAAYAHAIAQGYRFYSYGDASLLWRATSSSP
ncbi:MAG TPA: tRNA preQ1(34) S-adenosylmethionine ribosyltransferase-isomerase QueA [Hyphomonadaceae bacterium]|nr:tRNA preQ1(34) S-adenosylmethionine ribosyltransferase-isomerase QueA [Hyphomonadaceae bacterium]